MSDKIICVSKGDPVRGMCSQFDYRGFIVSMSTAFKANPEIMAWSDETGDENVFSTVQNAIEWIDKILFCG